MFFKSVEVQAILWLYTWWAYQSQTPCRQEMVSDGYHRFIWRKPLHLPLLPWEAPGGKDWSSDSCPSALPDRLGSPEVDFHFTGASRPLSLYGLNGVRALAERLNSGIQSWNLWLCFGKVWVKGLNLGQVRSHFAFQFVYCVLDKSINVFQEFFGVLQCVFLLVLHILSS